jgi:hypothetical protein
MAHQLLSMMVTAAPSSSRADVRCGTSWRDAPAFAVYTVATLSFRERATKKGAKPMIAKMTTLAAAVLGGLVVSTAALADAESKLLLNNPYQQGSTLSDCTASQCEVTFAATTDVKTVITAVSCIFALPPGASVVQSAFGPDDSVKFFVQPFLYGFSNLTGFNTYGINAHVNLFLKKGDIPAFVVVSSGGNVGGLECTISGYHS